MLKPTQTLSQTLSRLQTQGLDRLDAQLLLLHVLGQPVHQRAWLLAHDTDPLAAELAEPLQQLAQRRLAGEPLAYLTGHQEFFGLDLQVDARVLVPRPDTETGVDWALTLLLRPNQTPLTVLDLGTGSGAIALAIKSQRPHLNVYATDASEAALEVARANAQRLKLEVTFAKDSWFDAVPPDWPRFDLIVSNPPYIAQGDPHLAALSHEPAQALTSGLDGLSDLRHLITLAPTHLQPGGWLLLEHGYDQASRVRALLQEAGFAEVQSRHDLAGIERCSGGQWSHQG
ncbi:MAG: peptide chain release factor N(5)-glutamine methyltransferase [Rhodoferax sp.]|nr:peptide chain release factor N(5)-glutamine methyltransferase [Rhodoferax sp.]